MSSINSNEDPGCVETVVGITGFLALVFIGYVVWSIFSIGWPASILSMACFAICGIAYLVADWMKRGDPKQERLSIRIAGGVVSNTSRATLLTGSAFAIVWIIQLALNFLPTFIGPERALDLQLGAYDFADSLKAAVTPARFVIAMFLAITASVVAGAIWPINVVGTAKKWIGTFAAILIAFSSMTFVAVQTGSDRYAEQGVEQIRAKLGEDLKRLRQARLEQAALTWIEAGVRRQSASPNDIESWRLFAGAVASLCKDAERQFAKGYYSYEGAIQVNRPHYCRESEYVPKLVVAHLRIQEGVTNARPEPTSWVPEFGALGIKAFNAGTEAETLEAERIPRRYAQLKGLAKRIERSANNAEQARDRTESAVTSLLSSMLGESGSGAAEEVVKQLKEAVVKAIVRDGRDRVALWLRMSEARLPRAVEAILNIQPELHLVSPKADIEAAGGIENLVENVWARDHAPVDIEKYGRARAEGYEIEVLRQIEQVRQQREWARRIARQYSYRYRRGR